MKRAKPRVLDPLSLVEVKFNLIPHSKAKTSWSLLKDVIKSIREEPRRISMDSFCTFKSKEVLFLAGGTARPEPGRRVKFPACGTQGCIAGWMHNLTARNLKELLSRDAEQAAFDLLPHELRDEAHDLFMGHDSYVGAYDYTWPSAKL